MTSREPIGFTSIDRGRRRLFAVAMVLFAAWAIGLGIFAFTTAEKPRAGAPAPAAAE
jgi:hypothetical protein